MALRAIKSPNEKDNPLFARILEAAHRFLHRLADEGIIPNPADEERERGFPAPSLRAAVVDLLMDKREAFASILLQHLEGRGPFGRAEYLFMAYQIQQHSYHTNRISRQRFTELIRLQQELLRLFHSRFPDERYLLGNLNAYASCTGINKEVGTALERALAMAEKRPDGARFGSDLMTRNLIALLEKSDNINEVAFSNALSRHQDTLVTLAARAVYSDQPGEPERFARYLAEPVSFDERGTWYHLQVMSNSSAFWASLELERIVIPLEYRHFNALASGHGLERIARDDQSDSFMLHLPQVGRLYLSREELGALNDACLRILASPVYQSHNRIWSLLHGTAE